MNSIRSLRRRAGITQEQLASAAGTSQSAVAAYETDVKSPTLRTLQRLAGAVGLTLAVDFIPPLTREDRRSLALHLAIADQLQAHPEPVRRQARKNLRKMYATNPEARGLLAEWRDILRWPVARIGEVLSDPRPYARELRHVTPFAGVLSARQRAAVYREFRRSEAT